LLAVVFICVFSFLPTVCNLVITIGFCLTQARLCSSFDQRLSNLAISVLFPAIEPGTKQLRNIAVKISLFNDLQPFTPVTQEQSQIIESLSAR